jgi:uncharacterized protein YecE (DUF72 family)
VKSRVRIGTAGWTIPKAHAGMVGAEGSHLERYAQSLPCVEINSTFYRLPRPATLQRWVTTTPQDFRFAVKAPKAITHERMLQRCGAELSTFFSALSPLAEKLGAVLIQLPPKLAFDEGTAHEFFTTLRELHAGPVALEPRHESWFTRPVDQLLRSFEVARAMADPPAGSAAAAKPGGFSGLRYFRVHGSPRKYWSAYEEVFLRELAAEAARGKAETCVIFDNTAQGHALGNALRLKELMNAPV